jgi:hypothetical protein
MEQWDAGASDIPFIYDEKYGDKDSWLLSQMHDHYEAMKHQLMERRNIGLLIESASKDEVR